MSKFEKATIEKKANLYFDGKVSSRTIYLENGERVTLGLMTPGEYEFGTADKERMEMLGGELSVLLPNETKWQVFKENEAFEVPANSKFLAKTDTYADYCCRYFPS